MGRPRTLSVSQEDAVTTKIPRHTLNTLKKIAGLTWSTPGAIIERWTDKYGVIELNKLIKTELKTGKKGTKRGKGVGKSN